MRWLVASIAVHVQHLCSNRQPVAEVHHTCCVAGGGMLVQEEFRGCGSSSSHVCLRNNSPGVLLHVSDKRVFPQGYVPGSSTRGVFYDVCQVWSGFFLTCDECLCHADCGRFHRKSGRNFFCKYSAQEASATLFTNEELVLPAL